MVTYCYVPGKEKTFTTVPDLARLAIQIVISSTRSWIIAIAHNMDFVKKTSEKIVDSSHESKTLAAGVWNIVRYLAMTPLLVYGGTITQIDCNEVDCNTLLYFVHTVYWIEWQKQYDEKSIVRSLVSFFLILREIPMTIMRYKMWEIGDLTRSPQLSFLFRFLTATKWTESYFLFLFNFGNLHRSDDK